MRKLAAIFSLLLISCLSACAIHPLPENFTGLTSYQIVRQIRCETRDAAKQILIGEFKRLSQPDADPRGQAKFGELLSKYDNGGDAFSEFDADRDLPGQDYAQVRNYLDLLYAVGVAYDFDLDMKEVNNFDPTVNILGPWAPKLSLGLSGKFDRSRDNDRLFTATDTIGPLIKELNLVVRGHRYCDNTIETPNFVYPVVGHIGVYDTLHQYLETVIFTHLKPDDRKLPTPMSDKLVFTTTLDASATPKITFAGTSSGLYVTDTTPMFESTRTDTHRVTLSMALPASAQSALQCLSSYLFSSVRADDGKGQPIDEKACRAAGPALKQATRKAPAPGFSATSSLTASPANQAEELAVEQIDKRKSREIYLIPSP